MIRLHPVGRNLPERRSDTTHLGDLTSGRLHLILGNDTASGANVNERTSLGVPAVMACTALLSDMVAKLPIELFQRSRQGPRPVTRHPALAALNAPGDLHTSFELRQLLMAGKCLGGNGYARVYRDSNFRPTGLEWLKPFEVRADIVRRPNGQSFRVYEAQGHGTLYRQDVVHLPWISEDGITGLSPVRLLRQSIGTALSQTEAAGKLMKNGTMFPGYLKTAQTLSPDKIRDAREEWDRHYAGTNNYGRPPILNGGFEFQQTNGMSMSDAEFIDSRRFELQEIARHYRIPPFLIGDSTASTTWGTGIEQQTLGFLNFCLDPHLTAFEQVLNAVLLTSDEIARGYYFRFDRDELASVSRQDTASYFQTMRSIGVYSVNDIRRKLDEPTIAPEDGGDNYSLPFNNTGGAAKAAEAAPDTEDDTEDEDTPQPAPIA